MSSSSSSHLHAGLPMSPGGDAMVKESDSPGNDDPKSNGGPSGDKPQKPHRPLNRVPRACNACRKQKMKCTDADNPPCKRCRHAGIECVFEKPIRDTQNNSEQGMWRIRNLETQVTSIQSTLAQLVDTLRAAVPQTANVTSSSSASQQQGNHPTPPQPQHTSPYGAPSPSLSANSGGGVAPPYPNGSSSTSDFPPTSSQHQQHHQNSGPGYPANNNNSGPPRPYRSTSTSSGRTTGYQSSPGPHPPLLSPPLSGPQQQQQHPSEQMYRQQQDGMAPYPDHRSGQPPPSEQYPTAQSHHAAHHRYPHVPGQPQQPAAMPPPTSLPPFSALDVHPGAPGAPRPGATPLHVQTGGGGGGRQPFVSPLVGARKSISTSPVNGFQQPYGPPNHNSYSGMNPGNHHYGSAVPSQQPHYLDHHPGDGGHHHQKQPTDPLSSSNVTSADSSDDEGALELPSHGMIAPFVAIRGLADVAERVEENGGESDPPTRSGSPSRTGHYDARDSMPRDGRGSIASGSGAGGKRQSRKSGDSPDRPAKRRRMLNDAAAETPSRAVPDVVTKAIITEDEARELFNIFFTGCSMFLPVFDVNTDTFDALHKRSPFCVDAICMVAAKVRDGGGPPSETYKKCLQEVHDITCATLFAPVVRQEVVQAMILVAGWGAGPKDSGWLTCGHATRMALELGMHKAWPKLLKRMHSSKQGTSSDERELVISARTWFCLYLFEHQMSFGTGRPAVLKEDESVHECRLLLTHPLAIPDDMRLVSMVELMIIRERTQNMINPSDNTPVDSNMYQSLGESRHNFNAWLTIWSNNFSKRYEAAAFHRQSLEAQVAFAELYHNAIVLRTIKGPDDVAKMRDEQRELALRSMEIAQNALSICLRSPSYREGLKYAVQYTHLSATFTASFLMRLARLFPDDCDLPRILTDVDELVEILSEIPATRFARTLKFMLRSARRRRPPSTSRSSDHSMTPSARYAPVPPAAPAIMAAAPHMATAPTGISPSSLSIEQLDQFVRDMEGETGQDVPVWLSESNLGDWAISQQGLEAFLIPPSLDDSRMVPEIW